MPIARISDVTKLFDGKAVVDRVSFEIETGETFVLLGPSGSGKTTILRMIAGLEEPDSGTIELNGTITNDPRSRVAPERRGVAMVFQNLALWPHMTAAQNIEFGLRCRGESRDKRSARAAEMLALVDLPDRGGSYPRQLSGGERQRVALARALALDPAILCMDEPLSDLDPELKAELVETIGALTREHSISTVYVTHDQEEAMSLASRILVLDQGRIQQLGTPQELFERPASPFVASFVGFANILDGTTTGDGAVETVLGKLAADGGAAAPGNPVSIALRADAIRITDGGDGTPARIVQGHYRGHRWIYRVTCKNLELSATSPVPLAAGADARLVVDGTAAVMPRTASGDRARTRKEAS